MKETILQELVDHDTDEQAESIRVGILLTMAIGILNACTYVTRGKVFASSSSGNLLKLGVDIADGEFSRAGEFLFPVLLFALGVIIAEHFRDRPDYPDWRKIPFGIEIILIIAATFLPESLNNLANSIFGLCCGLQTITFRHIRKTPVQTVFINGSFQNSIAHYVRWHILKDHEDAFRSVLYLIIVTSYFFGIVAGSWLAKFIGHYVSLVSAALLIICMFTALVYEHHEKEENPQTAAVEK